MKDHLAIFPECTLQCHLQLRGCGRMQQCMMNSDSPCNTWIGALAWWFLLNAPIQRVNTAHSTHQFLKRCCSVYETSPHLSLLPVILVISWLSSRLCTNLGTEPVNKWCWEGVKQDASMSSPARKTRMNIRRRCTQDDKNYGKLIDLCYWLIF